MDGERLLARVCGELNLTHSLISEGNEMRALCLGVLAQSAAVLEQVATSQRQLAELRPGCDQRARLLVRAEQAGVGAARARHLYTALQGRPIEKRRPSAT